jgi:large subunit ribosomal protein L25
MPAVVYGAKEESTAIEVSAKDFAKTYAEAGESGVVSLVVDGTAKNVLIYEVDLDPLTNLPRHVDFYAIQKGQKIETEVPIVFVGEAPAVKELGANLIKVLHELKVEAEATAIPHEISVDVSGLTTINQQIEAKDLRLPPGVTLVTKPDEVIAIIAAAVEEPVEEVAAPDMAAIEISEERGKKPGEEDVVPEAAPAKPEKK